MSVLSKQNSPQTLISSQSAGRLSLSETRFGTTRQNQQGQHVTPTVWGLSPVH